MSKNKATLRFYGSLTDFTGHAVVETQFFLNPSVKDVIESQGVPHVAVFGLKVNNKSVQLGYNISDGDKIDVYPRSQSELENHPFNIRKLEHVHTRFIADVHLGKTARNLRLMGLDTLYSNTAADDEIVERAVADNRSVLTRDLGLLKNGDLAFGYWLRSTDPFKQTLEIMTYFRLLGQSQPLTRCLECNGLLYDVKKQEVVEDLPSRVRQTFDEFKQCATCRRIYWKGTHYQKLMRKIREIESSVG